MMAMTSCRLAGLGALDKSSLAATGGETSAPDVSFSPLPAKLLRVATTVAPVGAEAMPTAG